MEIHEPFVITDGKSTIAQVHVKIGETLFFGTGSSRRVKGDEYDSYVGELLAIDRAIQHLHAELKTEIRKVVH